MATAMAQGGGRGGGAGAGGRVLMEKDFKRIEKFTGLEVDWKAWEFDFKIAVRALSAQVAKALELVEMNLSVDATGEILVSDPVYGAEMVGMKVRAGELHEILCLLTSGDAKTMIRNASGGTDSQCGNY
jgi:hypothetical protein